VGKVEFGRHEKGEGLVGDKAALSLSRDVRCEEEARNESLQIVRTTPVDGFALHLKKAGKSLSKHKLYSIAI
jgi:hypothetical protein